MPKPAEKRITVNHDLPRIASHQLFRHGTPESDVREGLEFLVASQLGYLDSLQSLGKFVAANREKISPVVDAAIQKAKEVGKWW